MSNPFKYDEPVDGVDFTDRDDDLATLMPLIENGRNAILMSPRRYGKSSLLAEASKRAEDAGVRVGTADLMGCSSVEMVAQQLAAAVSRGPARGLQQVVQGLADRVARLRAGVSVAVEPTGALKLEVAPRLAGDEPKWEAVVEEVLHSLGEASKHHRVCLMVDEFQKTAEIQKELPGVFKRMSNRTEMKGVSLVLAGSKYHVMQQIVQNQLQRVGTEMGIEVIPEDVMCGFLQQHARSHRKPFAPGTAALVYRLAEGIPSDVQQLAFWAFESAVGRHITEEDVRTGLDRVVRKGAAVWDQQQQALPAGQVAVLRALAGGPVRSEYGNDFKRAVGKSSNNQIKKSLAALQELEYVERAAGAWRISSPFRRIWLARLAGYQDPA
ncbi:MAG: AAA family ATPase [Candidatus Dormibacteria bacterium]